MLGLCFCCKDCQVNLKTNSRPERFHTQYGRKKLSLHKLHVQISKQLDIELSNYFKMHWMFIHFLKAKSLKSKSMYSFFGILILIQLWKQFCKVLMVIRDDNQHFQKWRKYSLYKLSYSRKQQLPPLGCVRVFVAFFVRYIALRLYIIFLFLYQKIYMILSKHVCRSKWLGN